MSIDWRSVSIKDCAALVCSALTKSGIDSVLVGGACVSIYAHNKYLSYDLDFVSHAPMKDIARVLNQLGFTKGDARHYVRADCPFFIEVVSPPVALGNEPVSRFEHLRARRGTIILLTATDCVKDRLSAFYHWNDPQALEQAQLVAHEQIIDLKEVERWSKKEGFENKYAMIARELGKKLRPRRK